MNKEKIVKILIPVIALVVVIESVILVSGLNDTSKVATNEEAPLTEEEVVEEEKGEPVADYVFKADTKEMKVGKPYKVSLSLLGKEDFNVDAVELYVKFDPKMVSISKLVAGKGLPEATSLKADNDSGLLSAVFLVPVTDKDGFGVVADENKEIISFTVTPKLEGAFNLELETGVDGEKLVTVLPETGTSKSLSFTSSALDINVTK